MKKFLIATACLVLFLGSCQKKDPTQEILDVTKAATEKIEKAKDQQELIKIGEDYGKEIEALGKKYPDYKPTPEQEKQIQGAVMEMMSAGMKNKNVMPNADVMDLSGEAKETK